MRNYEGIFLAGIIAFYLFIIGCLYLANHNKKERHLQYWSPLLAVIAGGIVLIGHSYLNAIVDRYLLTHAPALRSYLFILVNIGFLAIYAALKAIVVYFNHAKRNRNAGRNTEDTSKSLASNSLATKSLMIFYEANNGYVKLKAEWRYAYLVFRHLSLVFGVLLTVYFVCSIGKELRSYVEFMPDYLAVVLLIFAECAWFLSGENNVNHLSSRAEEVNSQKSTAHEALFNEYLRLWSDKMLQSGVVHDSNENVTAAMHDLVQGLLQGKHLLIREGHFASISKVIFPAVYRLLLQNKKLILIVETDDEAEACLAWFDRGIEEVGAPTFAWSAAALGQAMGDNKAADLLVVKTVELLSEQLMEYIDAEYIQLQSELVIMVVEGSKLFSKVGSSLTLFSQRLRNSSLAYTPPQYVVFSEWAEDLGDAMHKIFHVTPVDIVFPESRAKVFYYAAVAQEKGLLQQRIMPRMVHRELDPEASLIVPALGLDIDHVKLVHYDSMPVKDNLDELSANIGHAVTDYSLPVPAIDRIRMGVEHYSRGWMVPESDQVVIISRDAACNLVHALGQWWSSSKENAVVVVVSPPYLLRDYLAANAAFFLQNHRKVAAIVPKPAMNRHTAYLYLMDKLSHTWLTAEEIQPYLVVAGIEEGSIWEGIHRYVELQGGADGRRELLNSRFVKAYNQADNTYKEIVQYRLNSEYAQKVQQSSTNGYAVQLQSGQTIAHLQGDHIFHSYLPGQVAVFAGKWYRIERIDPRSGRVELASESLIGQHLYKQSRTYAMRKDSVSQPNGIPVRRMTEQFEITFRQEFRSFDVYTNGYYDFKNGIDLHSNKGVYIPLSEKDQGYHRYYSQGSMLVVRINSLNGEFKDADRLAFTLSYLLNELFVSLYPHNHAQLAVSTSLSDNFFKGHDPVRDRICRYVPRLKASSSAQNNSETIQLYVLEDSPHSLGLLESVVQHWDHLLELLDDYLFWVWEENKRTTANARYISLGGTLPHNLFSFKELAAYIRRWLPEPSLRTLRTQYLKKSPEQGYYESLHAASSRSVKNRPVRTEELVAVAAETVQPSLGLELVSTKDELQEIYREVRTVMIVRLKLDIREGLRPSLVTAKALHSLNEAPIVPAVDNPFQMRGKTVRGDQGTLEVYIVNGMSRVATLAAMAHELTHIWQYHFLQLEIIPPGQLEGHAMWVEISVLESLGYLEEADQLREGLMDRDDSYGEGFRSLLARLDEDSTLSNPFVMMLSMYERIAV